MFKVLKNLKESWISVITIVLLLIVQAAGDLTLPDYTSKIVNVGIQNGGIENVAPEVIRKSEMENMWYTIYGKLCRGETEQEVEKYCKTVKLSEV